MEQRLTLKADQEERLDRFLARRIGTFSRSYLQQLIEAGYVTVNGRPRKPSWKLTPGDELLVVIPAPREPDLPAEAIPLSVLYEDADLIVINKPPGLTVHPAPGHERGTLVNALLAYCPDLTGIGGLRRPGIVHRLDKDTSGVIVVAKNERAHQELSRQIKERQVLKLYLALVSGELSPAQGMIEAPIARDPRHRQRMAVVSDGRPAQTSYRVLETVPGYSLVEAHLHTGRTHQVRVHFAAIGHPIIGDAVYGRTSTLIDRQALHAWRLGLTLPSDDTWREFIAPLPADFLSAMQAVGFSAEVLQDLQSTPFAAPRWGVLRSNRSAPIV